MGLFLKIVNQSFIQATQQLMGNKLRTFLSLLGISFGIWSVVSVMSAVGSLQNQVEGSLEKLGDDVVYIQKWPWVQTEPGEYYKYLKRPEASYEDYKALRKKLTTAKLTSFSCFIGQKTVEYKSSSVEGAFAIAITHDYGELFKVGIEKGRFFTERESKLGSYSIVIGQEVAKELFGNKDPVGKKVKFFGRKMNIVGLIEPSADELINPTDFDECVLMPYETARKLMNIDYNRVWDTFVNAKPKANVSKERFEDDITGVLRAHRRLKPKEDDNFALNKITMFAASLDSIFGALNGIGIFIGAFALLVGGISIANIMFVSVKERTSLIGLKMAIGAKRNIILLEFLIEAIVLCLIGGLFGLFLVFLTAVTISATSSFDFILTFSNILVGVSVSIFVGILAGIIPAYFASKMEPVEAIRA